MKYPFFASFIILCLLLMYEIHKRREKEAKVYQDFLDEEAKANSTRRQSLDDLEYITIPFESLPINVMSEDDTVKEYIQSLKDLSDNPIVNLTGFTNTELKLKYGAPNIDILSNYDQSYTYLVRTLNDWGKCLYDNGYTEDARKVLEFSISTKSDVKATYMTLASVYLNQNHPEKIKELIKKASTINSLMSKNIVSSLENMVN